MAVILVIEDRQALRELYAGFLRDLGHQVAEAGSAEEALKILDYEKVDLALCDYLLPGKNGLELVAEASERGLETLFIMMTAFGEVKLAVSCIKSGAFDFLEKPIDLDYLEMVVCKALEHDALKNKAVLKHTQDMASHQVIVGSSSQIREAIHAVDQVAPASTTCLLLGESGTGKELFAQRVHQQSPRADNPFVTINCAAIPPELLESELFGHEKGAFTGAVDRKMGLFDLAKSGTIFLDEIGELPLDLQPKLLRVMQDKTFRPVGSTQIHRCDIRIVCATNRDLKAEVQAGRFREDLYFRVAVFPITIAPLREHMDDIPELVAHFLKLKGAFEAMPDEKTLSRLSQYSWPGNIRELQNVVERALILSKEGPIKIKHLPQSFEDGSHVVRVEIDLEKPLNEQLIHAQSQVEETIVRVLWRRFKGNKTKLAQHLGISTKTLNKRLETWNWRD